MRGLMRASAGALAFVLVAGACGGDDGDDGDGAGGDDSATTTTTAPELDEEAATAEIDAAINQFLQAEDTAGKLEAVQGGDDADFVAIFEEIQERTASVALPVQAIDVEVEFTDATSANLTYLVAQQETDEILIPDPQFGSAVLDDDGAWRITATTVCDVAGLGAPDLVPDCLAAASAAEGS